MPRHHDLERQTLLPSANTHGVELFVPLVPSERISPFTLGRGTVFWRIWPAVVLHTAFAAVIYEISEHTNVKLGIPNVLLTVCGVVIGFVLSYRASSGYDRYWMGRSAWGDLMRHARTLARLIWFHVPPRLIPGTDPVPERDIRQVMREKRMAIKLIEGFAVATKHHLRGEKTIFYEDLFPLVEPLHQHPSRSNGPPKPEEPIKRPSLLLAIRNSISNAVSRVSFHTNNQTPIDERDTGRFSSSPAASTDNLLGNGSHSPPHVAIHVSDPTTPPPVDSTPSFPADKSALLPVASTANGSNASYGTFSDLPDSPATARPAARTEPSVDSSDTNSENGSDDGTRRNALEHATTPLFPATLSEAERARLPKIATDLVAFGAFVDMLSPQRAIKAPVPSVQESRTPADVLSIAPSELPDNAFTTREEYISTYDRKHRPRIPGGGENIPLQILWCISDWLATCERRNTVPGTTLGTAIATVGALEDCLGQTEKILMTPLPFVYSVHISVVWVYMFCMPFQLVEPFQVWTIPGVAIAAFFFLGLLAAGEEIEQPFGYDENDLNLDLFVNEILHRELVDLVHTAGANVVQHNVRTNSSITALCAPHQHQHDAQASSSERPKSVYVPPVASGSSGHDLPHHHIAGTSEVHIPAVLHHTQPVTSS